MEDTTLDQPTERFVFGGRRCRVIDLSRKLSNTGAENEPNPHRIDYVDHETSALAIGAKLDSVGLWKDDRGGAQETVELTTHSGTHVDAPYHYGPLSGGEPARRVDALPLRWCMGNGVLLDFTHKGVGEGIEAADVRSALDAIDYELAPFDIVLIRTDASRGYGEPGYTLRQPGLRRSGTELLVEAGVRMIGIDAWGLDRPFDVMVAEGRAGDTAQFWESHYFGQEQEYAQIEQLANLDQIPVTHGFTVIALPILLDGASAAWSRVVAIVDED
jgi:kynurenine formamidase